MKNEERVLSELAAAADVPSTHAEDLAAGGQLLRFVHDDSGGYWAIVPRQPQDARSHLLDWLREASRPPALALLLHELRAQTGLTCTWEELVAMLEQLYAEGALRELVRQEAVDADTWVRVVVT